MKYNCSICSYDTDDLSHINRHKKSNKHISKSNQLPIALVSDIQLYPKNIRPVSAPQNILNVENPIFKCEYCEAVFTKRPNLYRHKQFRCKIFKKDKLVEDLKKQNEELKNELHQKDKNEIIKLENQIKYFKSLVGKAGNIINTNSETISKSISALTYLTQQYSNAPALELVSEDRYKEIAVKKFSLAQTVVHYYREKRLATYLGGFVIFFYKKDNPKDNSVWATDVARRTFYIKEKHEWTVDKVAKKTSQNIIEPMLDYIKQDLEIYNNEENKLTKDMKQSTSDMSEHVLNNSDGMDIIQLIDKGYLKNQIIKFITPSFQLEKINKANN